MCCHVMLYTSARNGLVPRVLSALYNVGATPGSTAIQGKPRSTHTLQGFGLMRIPTFPVVHSSIAAEPQTAVEL